MATTKDLCQIRIEETPRYEGATTSSPFRLSSNTKYVLAQVGPEWRGAPSAGGSLRKARRQFEREYIAAVLGQHDWRMSDAARALGIQRTNLYRKDRQLNIPRVRVTRSSHA